MVTDNYVLKRIEMLQEEVDRLRRTIIKEDTPHPLSLRGIWKGVNLSDEEFREAKRSWVRGKG